MAAVAQTTNRSKIRDRTTPALTIYRPMTEGVQLHVNLQYPVTEETARALTATAPLDLDIEAVQAAARLTAERTMVSRVARTLVYSLGKRGRPREWNEIQLRFVFSPEALNLAADDTHTGRQEAEGLFAEALKTIPKAAPAEESPEAVTEA